MKRFRVDAMKTIPFLCALLLLGACARTDTGRSDEGSGDSTKAAPVDRKPERWEVREDGVGPAKFGTPLDAAGAALGTTWIAPDSTAQCRYVRPAGGPDGISFMVVDGLIVRADVTSDKIATSSGARVGDDEKRIESLYPGRVTVTPHKYTNGHYLSVTSATDSTRIVFETDGARVVRYRAGRLPEIDWLEGCS
jgi:hypothetical protein